MKGLRKAAEVTRCNQFNKGVKIVIYYRLDTEEVMTDTIYESAYPAHYDGFFACGVCTEPKTWKEIKKMVDEKIQKEMAYSTFSIRRIDFGIWKAEDVVEIHKSACGKWSHGEVDESWINRDGYLCIRYADGMWFHYGLSALSDDVVWW